MLPYEYQRKKKRTRWSKILEFQSKRASRFSGSTLIRFVASLQRQIERRRRRNGACESRSGVYPVVKDIVEKEFFSKGVVERELRHGDGKLKGFHGLRRDNELGSLSKSRSLRGSRTTITTTIITSTTSNTISITITTHTK